MTVIPITQHQRDTIAQLYYKQQIAQEAFRQYIGAIVHGMNEPAAEFIDVDARGLIVRYPERPHGD